MLAVVVRGLSLAPRSRDRPVLEDEGAGQVSRLVAARHGAISARHLGAPIRVDLAALRRTLGTTPWAIWEADGWGPREQTYRVRSLAVGKNKLFLTTHSHHETI